MPSGAALVMSVPLKLTAPAATRCSPDTAASAVVLPAPLAPSSATISRYRTSSETPCKTSRLP
jgi:hypothetical protein